MPLRYWSGNGKMLGHPYLPTTADQMPTMNTPIKGPTLAKKDFSPQRGCRDSHDLPMPIGDEATFCSSNAALLSFT